MIPLAFHQRMWTLLCVCPLNKDSTTWKRWFCVIFLSTIFVLNVSLVLSSITFVSEFWSSDLKGSLHALFQLATHMGVVYVVIVQIMFRQRIAAIFAQLQQIYHKCIKMESQRILEQTNKKSEWLWQFYLKFMFAVCSNTFGLAIFSAFACWFKFSKFDADYVYHPYKMILPWNLKTPFGYLGEICYQVSTGGSYMFINGTTLLLFIAICLHHQAFFEIYNDLLQNFQRDSKQQNDRQILCEVIDFHDMAKRWMLQSAEVYSPFVLFQLICLAISLACVIFQLDLQIENIGFDASVLIMALTVFSANTFLYCFFGKKTTDYYGLMANLLFESNWQRFPIHLQKYLILMIANMQIPLHFNGSQITILNLETFAKLFKSVISYYLMFKTISSE